MIEEVIQALKNIGATNIEYKQVPYFKFYIECNIKGYSYVFFGDGELVRSKRYKWKIENEKIVVE